LSRADRVILHLLMGLGLFSTAMLTFMLVTSVSGLNILTTFGLAAITSVEIIRLLQSATLWRFARSAKDPIPLKHKPGLRIAVLTTIVPGKEPFAIVSKTLLAMKELRHAPEDKM